MNSEEYLLKAIKDYIQNTFYIVPFKTDSQNNEKQLINARKNMAKSVDVDEIIAIIDTSFRKEGREGVVFTGDTMYLHSSLVSGDDTTISLSGMLKVDYESIDAQSLTKKNFPMETLFIQYDSGETKRIETKSNKLSFKGLWHVLRGFIDQVDVVQVTKQNVRVNELSDEGMETYFKILINYFEVDGVIPPKAYTELAGMLGEQSFSSKVETNIREYRLGVVPKETTQNLLEILIKEVPFGSRDAILGSIIKDVLSGKTSKELENIEEDAEFLELARMLKVTDQQIKAFIKFIKNNKTIIENRLKDKELLDLAKESAAVLAGAGVVAGSVAATASSAVAMSILFMSTGGLALVGLGVGSVSFAAYKGVKYLTTGNDTIDYGMRNNALNSRIKFLSRGQNLMLRDINYITQRMADITKQLDNSQNKIAEFAKWLQKLQSVEKASSVSADQNDVMIKEQLISELPKHVDSEKLWSLISNQAISFEKVTKQIEAVYDENFELIESASISDLETMLTLLETIEYNKVMTTANAKSIVSATVKTQDQDEQETVSTKLKDFTNKNVFGSVSKFITSREKDSSDEEF